MSNNNLPQKYSFLGPLGTFCHQALTQLADPNAKLFPCTSERLAMDKVRHQQVQRCVVPIENSVEGGVNATLDSLGFGTRLQIVAETIVPVGFTLAVRPGTKIAQIKRVGTHTHAWAQCRNWMADNLPEAVNMPTASTARSAQLLAESEECGFQAVLASKVAVEMYGLEPVYADVADNRGAVTRFVELALPGQLPEPTGADKTTLQVRLPKDRAGALLQMLQQFSTRGVNLTRIESRPVAGQVGRYAFSLDIDGHICQERVQAALEGIYRTCEDVRFLGSYKRADRVINQIAENTTDRDFQQARKWVSKIIES